MATTKYNEMNFSSRMKNLRGSRSQAEFAEFLGITSQQTYQNYERGRIPKLPILQQISQRTGVSLSWLMTGEGEKTPNVESGKMQDSKETENVLREDVGVYRTTSEYLEMVVSLAETADLNSLLDTLENLARISSQGDKRATDAIGRMVPIIRRRIEAQTKLQP